MSKGSILIYTSAAGQAAPLPGVTLTVTDAGGSVRARLVTDADGFAEAADLPALESQRDALTARRTALAAQEKALTARLLPNRKAADLYRQHAAARAELDASGGEVA